MNYLPLGTTGLAQSAEALRFAIEASLRPEQIGQAELNMVQALGGNQQQYIYMNAEARIVYVLALLVQTTANRIPNI